MKRLPLMATVFWATLGAPCASLLAQSATGQQARGTPPVLTVEKQVVLLPETTTSDLAIDPRGLSVVFDGRPQEVVSVGLSREWRTVIYLDPALSTPDGIVGSIAALVESAPRLTEMGTVEIVVADPFTETYLEATRDTEEVQETLDELEELADAAGEILALRGEIVDAVTDSGLSAESRLLALQEEAELLQESRLELLRWISDRTPKGPTCLILIQDGFDLGAEFAKQLTAEPSDVFAETLAQTTQAHGRLAATLASAGWTVLPMGLETAQSDLLPGRSETLALLADSTGGSLVAHTEELGPVLQQLGNALVVTARVASIPDGIPRPFEVRVSSSESTFKTPRWASVGTPIGLSDIRTLQTLEEADLLVGPLSTTGIIRPDAEAAPQPEGFPGVLEAMTDLDRLDRRDPVFRISLLLIQVDGPPSVRSRPGRSWRSGYRRRLAVPSSPAANGQSGGRRHRRRRAQIGSLGLEPLGAGRARTAHRGAQCGDLGCARDLPAPTHHHRPRSARRTGGHPRLAAKATARGGQDALPDPGQLAHHHPRRLSSRRQGSGYRRQGALFRIPRPGARSGDAPGRSRGLCRQRRPTGFPRDHCQPERRQLPGAHHRDRQSSWRHSECHRRGPSIPRESELDRVEFYWNETLVETLQQPPFQIELPTPDPGAQAFVRVAAYLTDGTWIDDAQLLGEGSISERVEVNLVELHVVVTDRDDKPVEGLDTGDFTVRLGRQEQEIQRLGFAEDVPLTLGVVIDTSESMYALMVDTQKAGAQFVANTLTDGDAAFLVDFDTQPRLAQDTTTDLMTLLKTFSRFQPDGATAMYDAIIFSMLQFEERAGPQGPGPAHRWGRLQEPIRSATLYPIRQETWEFPSTSSLWRASTTPGATYVESIWRGSPRAPAARSSTSRSSAS